MENAVKRRWDGKERANEFQGRCVRKDRNLYNNRGPAGRDAGGSVCYLHGAERERGDSRAAGGGSGKYQSAVRIKSESGRGQGRTAGV